MSTHLPERFHPLRSHSSTSTSTHEGSREGSREESREGCVPFILKEPHFRCIRFFTDVSQFFYLSTGILGMCNLTLPIRKLLHGIWCPRPDISVQNRLSLSTLAWTKAAGVFAQPQ